MAGFFTYRQFSLDDTPSLTNKVAVVTLLLHRIEKVYVLARSHDKYLRAQEDWQRRAGSSLGKDDTRVQFIQCDLADIVAAKDAANELKQRTDRLDIMICNAGTFSTSLFY
ncbi:hypothetical protein APSETT444_009178 [Aspergillus pseudonomiae]